MATSTKPSVGSKGYRSLKRALGETNLERKCRWLFGICLLALISLAFWWVDRIGEDLAERITLSKGREWVRVVIFDYHWQRWTSLPAEKAVQMELSHALMEEDYGGRFLALEDSVGAMLPQSQEERQVLTDLQSRLKAQLMDEAKQGKANTPLASAGGAAPAQPSNQNLEPISASRLVPEEGSYYYYQPVYWKDACLRCHEGMYGKFAVSAGESGLNGNASMPFRVVRVTLPYDETRSAINYTRAVLMAVAILTVSLAMIALWLVVRYVVVKPLNHLRDVSDAITRGDLDQRADIHTNDEFEELAASFNKMLRHVMETQGELRELNASLDFKVDELAQLNMRLHEMNRLKGEFLATMSHELRTPLNSIIGFSDVLQGVDSFTEKQKRYVQNIQTSGRQLLEMINDILDLAKMEAGKMDVRLSEFRIDAVISAQCDMVDSLTDDKNIDLRIEVENDLPLLYQDQAKVQQILQNLLSNAIKFTPEGGRITVGARGDARGFVEMFVADTGVGIAEADREVIFEKFRQGATALGRDNLTREYSGTGLGLSIVKELCKLLGGEVHVESELGKGSTFRVLIPWMRADRPQATASIHAKLDDLTKPRRVDFQREPEPLADSGGFPVISSLGE